MRRLVCAAVLAFFALLLTATAAFADGFPPVIGGGGTEQGNPGGGSTPGGHSTPTPAPEGTTWTYGGTPLTPEVFAWNEGPGSLSIPTQGGENVHGRCNPGTINGDRDWTATGASWSFLLDDKTGAYAGQYGYSCNIPPQPRDTQVRCAETMQAVITQERDPANQRMVRDRTTTSAWATDRQNPDKCAQSLTVAVDAPMDRLGGYLVAVTGATYPCTQRTYPGANRPDRIVRCGTAATTTKTLKGGIWCAPGGIDWALGETSWDHDFTWAACADETGDLIDCQLDAQAPTFAGRRADTDPVEVLDDGTLRPLVYGAFKPTGPIVSTSNVSTRLEVDRAKSSPYRAGAAPDGPTQPFYAVGGFGPTTGDRTTWATAFMAPGVPGSPWTAKKVITFDAQVRIRTVTIRRINFDTMAATTTEKMTVVPATGITCDSPNARVAVLRARITT